MDKIKKTMKKHFKTFRFWLLKKLFTEDEKYLIARAIDERISNYDKIGTEALLESENIKKDYNDYKKLKRIFRTDLWK